MSDLQKRTPVTTPYGSINGYPILRDAKGNYYTQPGRDRQPLSKDQVKNIQNQVGYLGPGVDPSTYNNSLIRGGNQPGTPIPSGQRGASPFIPNPGNGPTAPINPDFPGVPGQPIVPGGQGGVVDPRNLNPALPGTPPGAQGPAYNETQAFLSKLNGQPYFNTPAFQTLINNITSDPNRTLVNDQNAAGFADQITTWANTFSNYFKNLTGQDPTADEYNMFFDQVVNPQRPWENRGSFEDQTKLLADTQSFVTNNLSKEVEKAAQDKATKQAQDATAEGSPFDQWSKAYMSSINGVESSLKDYQSRLFEKLRPNLLTSLKAQGLLDTGALDTAFAGAASDLDSTGANYVAGLRSDASTNIANQKLGILSQPTNFALQNTFNTPTNMTSAGTAALNNAYSYDIQRQLMQQQFSNQQSLLNQQYAQQPSLLSQYGGQILGGVAAGVTNKYLH